MDGEKLYIPYGLTTQQEYFTGFGKSELKQCVIGMAAFAIISALIYVITGEVGGMMLTALIGISASIIMTRKDVNTQISVVGQIRNLIRFSKSQKKYKYIYKR